MSDGDLSDTEGKDEGDGDDSEDEPFVSSRRGVGARSAAV